MYLYFEKKWSNNSSCNLLDISKLIIDPCSVSTSISRVTSMHSERCGIFVFSLRYGIKGQRSE